MIETPTQPKPVPLTDRQRELLEFIAEHLEATGKSPSYRVMAQAMGVTIAGMVTHLSALERKGWITRDPVCLHRYRLVCNPDGTARDGSGRLLTSGPRMLTDRQREIYEYLCSHALEHGFQPSIRELMTRFSSLSPNGIMCHIRAIASKGWMEQSNSHSRSHKLLYRPDGQPFRGYCYADADDTDTPSEASHS